jgi:hypothetical protein
MRHRNKFSMNTITLSAVFFSILASTISFSFANEPAATNDQRKPSSDADATTTPAVPFAFADFSWIPGNYAPPDSAFATKYFTPEIRLDTTYHYEFSNPLDNTVVGSSEVFRSNEFQITQVGVGGDFNYNNVGFRLMTQFGMYSTTTPRNDASPQRGQWNLADSYRYISEAYGTYHLDVMNGINIQAGLFMSYVGLWSYYNFDNWTYQPSYVSSNTPWFFNGMRVQFFPSDKLKIEPWIINGWQSYGQFGHQPGLGLQIMWRPNGRVAILGNQYYGSDDSGLPDRRRYHTDDSIMVKYWDGGGGGGLSQAAASLTVDAGCDTGSSGINTNGLASSGIPAATCGNNHFIGAMAYNRFWFDNNHYGFTLGGGAIQNPGRYLVLTPPINGATAYSGAADFPQTPGTPFWAWDAQVTTDYMPNRNLTFRLEYTHRWSNVPYFAGHGGVTPPGGNNTTSGPGVDPNGFSPDLVKVENRLTLAMLVRL